jgi:hypothetical protein
MIDRSIAGGQALQVYQLYQLRINAAVAWPVE